MEREYVAFISYRHKPLDIEIAEKVHKLLERYRVPKELRKNGKKNLGIVFRDRDELPLTSNLTENIYEALEHSEFLIVICTPDTPKSMWVEKEISYFIEKHGRERVLIVLAEGTVEESVPKQLTTIYAEDGQTIQQQIEPLCAYLAEAKNKSGSLKKEFLRLVAAILGCPYDSLIQRQKKYRAQILSIVLGIFSTVALLFLMMMANYNYKISQKNEEISKNFLESQKNETQALTLLSNQQRKAGERFEAIKSALAALPGEGDTRPYSPDAEAALTDALHPYGNGNIDYISIIEQDEEVHSLEVSDDGKYVVTMTPSGRLLCFDTATTRMLWEYSTGNRDENWYNYKAYHDYKYEYDYQLLSIDNPEQTLIYFDREAAYFISMSTGELLHKIDLKRKFVTLSSDETMLLQYSDVGIDIFDTSTYEHIQRIQYEKDKKWRYSDTPKFSSDNSKLLIPLYNSDRNAVCISIWNTENWELESEHFIDPMIDGEITDIEVTWLSSDSYMLYYMVGEGYTTYDIHIHKYLLEGEEVYHQSYEIPREAGCLSSVAQAVRVNYNIYYIFENMVLSVRLEKGNLEYVHQFGQNEIKGHYLRYDNVIVILLDDGSVNYVFPKYTSQSMDYPVYNCKIRSACVKSEEKDSFCLIPEDNPNFIFIIQETDNQDTKELKPFSDQVYNRIDVCMFPEYQCFLIADCNDGEVAIYDTETLEKKESFGATYGSYVSSVNISADGKKLLCDEYIFDLESYDTSSNEIPGYVLYYVDPVNQKPGEPVLMATHRDGYIYWWKDGGEQQCLKIPYGEDAILGTSRNEDFQQNALKPGGNGLIVGYICYDNWSTSPDEYLICSAKDGNYKRWKPVTANAGDPEIAVGETEAWVAFADFDWKLRIYDYDQNTIIQEYELPVSPDTIEKMVFIAKDKYLLIVQDLGWMTIINTENGFIEAKYKIEYDAETTFFQIDEETQMLYVCDYKASVTGRKIDMENWGEVVEIPGLLGYLEGSNQIVQLDKNNNRLTVSPIYSLEELIEKGNILLSGSAEDK